MGRRRAFTPGLSHSQADACPSIHPSHLNGFQRLSLFVEDFQTPDFTGFDKRWITNAYVLYVDSAHAKEHQCSGLEILKPHGAMFPEGAGFPVYLGSPG